MGYTYQDVLALVGAGSAHPGGFAVTVDFLHYLRPDPSTRVLEVGCGTGRTACYVAKTYGAQVTGIDVHPLMIKKATARAENEGLLVKFIEGDVTALPFDSATFDLILAESVTVFTDVETTIREYHRVLAPGGVVGDVEMAALKKLPTNIEDELCSLYGARLVPTFGKWRKFYTRSAFHSVMLWKPRAVEMDVAASSDAAHPDHQQMMSPEAFQDERVGEILRLNMETMEKYKAYLGYTGIVATKANRLV